MENAVHSQRYMKPSKHTETGFIIMHPNMWNQDCVNGAEILLLISGENHSAAINAVMNLKT